jgi:TRAP-type C4-dicarboxylate transport system substrate-binding protein
MRNLVQGKLVILMLVLSLVGLSLVGCGAAGDKTASSSGNETSKSSEKSSGSEPVTLKLAHQWAAPTGDKGDYRSLLAVKFAEEVEKRSNGSIKVEVYPANSLTGPKQQFDALNKGSLDMAVWAPFYAAGKVPEFSISLMPGIIKSSDQAWKWKDAEVGKEVESLLEENGSKILIWTWAPTTFATVGDKKIIDPKDIAGLKFRGAGKDSEKMFENLGAGIVSMPSSEIYSALQTKVLDGTLTSYDSFMSYRLYEVVDHFYYPGNNAPIMYAMMPLVISKKTWDNRLSDEQKNMIQQVSDELQDWVVNQGGNEEVAQVFRDHGVDVYEITQEQAEAWYEAAQPTVDAFAASSDRAKRLIEAARSLK